MKASPKARQIKDEPKSPAWLRGLLFGALVMAGLLALTALGQMARASGQTTLLASEGWGEYASVIVRNRIFALWHGAFMAGCAAAFLYFASTGRSWRRMRWGLVALVAADAVLLARHYVQTLPRSAVQENEVVRLLKSGPREKRVALVTQESFYNNWLTYLFPYHGIKSVNLTQMPRMPVEYQQFLQTMGRNPLRLWQLMAVQFVLAPAQAWSQIQADPAMQGAFTKALDYNVGLRDGELVVTPANAWAPGQHVVLQFQKPAPYAVLLADWSVMNDDEILRRLADPSFDLFQTAALAPEQAAGLPVSDAAGTTGAVRMETYRPGRMKMKVSCDRPALLRVAEKFDPGWSARVNGQPAPVRRLDYLFMGVLIEPGEHEVEFAYEVKARSLYVLMLGGLGCLGAAIMAVLRRTPSAASAPSSEGMDRLLFGVVLLLVVLGIFRSVVLPGRFLFTTDDNIGDLALRKTLLPGGFQGAWYDGMLAGFPIVITPGWTHLWLWWTPLIAFVNWIHGADLVLASLALAAFLRRRGLGWPACALAVLAAFWVGSNFTLTYAGHIMKFGILMWAAVYLWLLDHAVESGRPAFAVLAGGALGAMFLEQADVALFFSLVLGPYALFRLWSPAPSFWPRSVQLLLPLVATAGLVAFHPLWENYRANVRGVASLEQEDPAEKWAFITQWSWPPEESIDFIAPGYMGWRSGEPEGPYWGRMGRSEGWEQTRRGFQNFKLENQYLGFIPLALALAALLAAVSGGKSRAEIFFWAAAALLTLLLSFGKYFPLYAIFYKLPVINNIRNPNKFLQVFQLAVALLAAWGFDRVQRAPLEADTKRP